MKKRKILIGVILLCIATVSCSQINSSKSSYPLINGVVFDGPAKPPITNEMISGAKISNANWIAAIPEAITFTNSLEVKSYLNKGQWYGESLEGAIKVMKYAKANDLKSMLKPHFQLSVDLSNWSRPEGLDLKKQEDVKKFVESQQAYIASQKKLYKGNGRAFEPIDKANWPIWEEGYEKFILECARIADSTDVSIFCIGTELSSSTVQRPEFWKSLIKKVKNIYSGQITYGANWDNYKNITFWDELDYIGISAYFPITDKKNPSLNDVLEGWKPHYEEIKKISDQFKKPILFTEYGYRSVNVAGNKPWLNFTAEELPDEETQAVLYQGIYETFWNESWFAGGFIWKWYYKGNGGAKSYSPSGKKALEVVKREYTNDQ